MLSTLGSIASQNSGYSVIPNSNISWVIINEQAEEPRKVFNLSNSSEVHLKATPGTYGDVWIKVRSSIPFDFSKYTKLILSCLNNGQAGTYSATGINSFVGYCDVNGNSIGSVFSGSGGGYSFTDRLIDITSITQTAYIYVYLALNSYQTVDLYSTKLTLSN